MNPAWLFYEYVRPLPDGRVIAVHRRMFNSILIIGDQDDGFGYTDHW